MARIPESEIERLRAEVSVQRLVPGDRVRVPVGQAFPADATVIDGSTRADESLLTGESVPVAKPLGAAVVAVPIAPGLIPTEPLKAGDTVRLVQAPAQGVEVTGAPAEITGTVLNVTAGDTETVVDVLVADNRAGELAARAASGDLALVLASRER